MFSREFPVTRMAEAVIGRRKIDSYVMFFTNLRGIPLIDCSTGGRNWGEIAMSDGGASRTRHLQ